MYKSTVMPSLNAILNIVQAISITIKVLVLLNTINKLLIQYNYK